LGFEAKCCAIVIQGTQAVGLNMVGISPGKPSSQHMLVGGIPTPLKNMSSSVGMMNIYIYGLGGFSNLEKI
jgi:hypothetical protein